MKEAYRPNIIHALGEDAVNIAWTIFLSFTRRYTGDDFQKLPGLIQCHLHYELQHAVEKKGQCWDNEVNVLDYYEADMAEDCSRLKSLLLNMSLNQELKRLSKRQIKILWCYYFLDQSHETIAKSLHCAARTVGYQRLQALKLLRNKISD